MPSESCKGPASTRVPGLCSRLHGPPLQQQICPVMAHVLAGFPGARIIFGMSGGLRASDPQ